MDVDGYVKNVEVIKSFGPDVSEEAVHVIERMHCWIPTTKDEKPVPVRYTQPFRFELK